MIIKNSEEEKNLSLNLLKQLEGLIPLTQKVKSYLKLLFKNLVELQIICGENTPNASIL